MPPDLETLRGAFHAHEYLLTEHASERAAQRGILAAEIEQAIETGEVIEDYPEDKYGPSCLIYGRLSGRRDLHVQVSYPAPYRVITVYEPNPDEWESGRTRISR